MTRIIGGYALGQFMKIGLGTDDGPFGEQSLQRWGIFSCRILKCPRTASGNERGSVYIIFDYGQ